MVCRVARPARHWSLGGIRKQLPWPGRPSATSSWRHGLRPAAGATAAPPPAADNDPARAAGLRGDAQGGNWEPRLDIVRATGLAFGTCRGVAELCSLRMASRLHTDGRLYRCGRARLGRQRDGLVAAGF